MGAIDLIASAGRYDNDLSRSARPTKSLGRRLAGQAETHTSSGQLGASIDAASTRYSFTRASIALGFPNGASFWQPLSRPGPASWRMPSCFARSAIHS